MFSVDSSFILSKEPNLYGNDVVQRTAWDGQNYETWVDASNPLPAGHLRRVFVYAMPDQDSDLINSVVLRTQIWRNVSQDSAVRFQLVWQRRINLQTCNSSRGPYVYVRFATQETH